MEGEGHIRMYGVLQIGHTIHEGHQRLQCWPFPDRKFFGFNREDLVFVRLPGMERFVLSPDNVWYGRLKHRYDHDLARADSRAGAGDGCPMYFVNSWALGWSRDQ